MEGEGGCSLATVVAATDPTAEQGLEVEGRRERHWQRCTTRRHDGEGATATAMWHGCWRGDFFEGCEWAQSGKPPTDQTSIARRFFLRVLPPGSGGVAAGGRNAANPFRYRDATSLGPPSRRKPSRWCETMRAERVVRTGIRMTDGGGDATRSGREEASRRRGATTPSSESHERQVPAQQATATAALRIGSGALKARRRS